MEEILGPVMFDIPGSEEQGIVKITKAVVVDGAVPQTLPFKNSRQEKSA
jgi:ATP-dependent Clp protease ATP-binding subunit ClpX